MNKIIGTAAAATLLAAPAAMAATLTIDDFTFEQVVQHTSGVTSSTVSDGMLGGSRTMTVANDQEIPTGTSLISSGGTLSFNNTSGSTGTGWIVYDAGGAGSLTENIGVDVTTDGLGGVDFTFGGVADSFFTFVGTDFNKGVGAATASFTAYAWDMGGNRAEFSEILGGPDFSELLFLSEFTSSIGLIDWSQVGALAFRISSTDTTDINFNGSIKGLTLTPIPLPASALLLLGGLGGLAGVSFVARRRHKA